MATMMKKTNPKGPAAKKPMTSKGTTSTVSGMMPVVPKVGGSVTHTIEKIDNGFLHRHSMHDGKGNFDSKTIYSPKATMTDVVPPPKSSTPQRGTNTQKMDGKQKMNTPQKLNKPMKLSAASKKSGATDVK